MSGRTAYDVAGHYDAGYYEDLAARYRTRNRFARQRIANVLSLLPPLDGRVLVDVGCGMGTFTVEAAHRGARALGIDFAPEALPAAAAVARAAGDSGHGFKFAPVLGGIISDAVEGRENPWLHRFRWRDISTVTLGKEEARFHG